MDDQVVRDALSNQSQQLLIFWLLDIPWLHLPLG